MVEINPGITKLRVVRYFIPLFTEFFENKSQVVFFCRISESSTELLSPQGFGEILQGLRSPREIQRPA